MFGDLMAARRPHNTTLSTPMAAPATFDELGVPARLTAVLADLGIATPFPIQAATLPDSLAGRDVLGRGKTGSGKTYAFLLAVLARLAAAPAPRRPGRPRALILVPTRELATQIQESMAPLARALSLVSMTVFGGVPAKPQIAGLRAGVDVLVACPGRLADHVAAGHAYLNAVEITVLDEADHMADLGFLPVVRRLLAATPRTGQRLLFSATLDAGVDVLVRQFLTRPVTHSIDPPRSAVTAMSHHVFQVRHDDRVQVLVDLTAAPGRTVVFTRTKHRAKTLTRQLVAAGVPAVELHGNLAQTVRSRNLLAFSSGTVQTLVATDIAARGIHVDDVNLVIHADPPVEHKAYLHRSGRTARAGAAGTVITLMTDDQVRDVRALTRNAGITPVTTRLGPGHPLLRQLAPGRRSFVAPPVAGPTAPNAAPRSAGARNRTGLDTRRSRAGRSTAAPRNPGGSTRTSSAPTDSLPPQAARRRGTSTATGSARQDGAAAFSGRSRAGARHGDR
jgi:superfamily II DNA/RNA helicase